MFGLGLLDGLVIVGMIACLIGLRVCSKNQRTMKNAQLVAVLLLCGVFACAGTLLWRQFIKGLVVDPAEVARARAKTQWAAQGYGLAQWINGQMKSMDKLEGEGILVIYEDSEYNKDNLEAFKTGLSEGGVSASQVEYKPLSIANAGPVGMPGMSLAMLMTAQDIQNAMKGDKKKVVISLVGVPPMMGIMANGYDRNLDFTNRGKRAFIVAGNVYQNPSQIQMAHFGQITALVQLKFDAPDFESSYPAEAPKAFDAFYHIVTQNNAEKAYQDYQANRAKK